MASKAAASERLQARLRARAKARKTQSSSQSGSVVSSKASARKARRQRDRKALEKCCGSSLPGSFDTFLDSPFGIPAQKIIDPPYVLRHPQFMNVSTGRDVTGNVLSAASRSLTQLILQDPHRFMLSVIGRSSQTLALEQRLEAQQQQPDQDLGLRVRCESSACTAGVDPPVRVLTVGSGLGLPGLMMQRTLKAHVVLTDRNRVVLDMLRLNAQLHHSTSTPTPDAATAKTSKADARQYSRADVKRLAWGSDDDVAAALDAFRGETGSDNVFPDLVVSTECFSEYSDADVKALAHTLLLCCGKRTTVGIAFERPPPVELSERSGQGGDKDGNGPRVDSAVSAEQLERRQVVQNKFQMLVFLLHCGGLQSIEFGDVDTPSGSGCVPYRLPSVESTFAANTSGSTTKSKSVLTAFPPCFLALFRRSIKAVGSPMALARPNGFFLEGTSSLLPSASSSFATHSSKQVYAQPRSPLFVALPISINPEKVAQELQIHGFCIIDNFLPPKIASAVLQESLLIKRNYLTSVAAGQSSQDLIHIRSDVTFDVDPLVDPNKSFDSAGIDDGTCSLPLLSLVARILQFPLAHSIGMACGEKFFARERPQFAIYPGRGSFYVEHFDNPKLYDEARDNGRRLTAVFYLNRKWDPVHGGALRVDGRRRRGGGTMQNSGVVEVFPEHNRLVLFWSDEIPHEVLPAYASRSALTVWLNRGTDSTASSNAPNSSHEDPRELAEIVYDEMAKIVC
eukprot:INCI11317.2.p1 GENE.INCI11317.2~~INCI11317.2.p1  ORF type:complete len:738 (-),score=111.26 INCI11317.2:389-2602(-)